MTSTAPIRFGVVGSGRRTRFFLRLARMAPEHLAVSGVVTRTAERGAEVEAEWGVPTFRTLEELAVKSRPEFVVASVPWAVMPDVLTEAVGMELRVLSETPPAPTAEGLRKLWDAVGASGLVQVAEQYLLMPGHAARLALLREGMIGEVTSVQVSSTHLYHTLSMIRHMLGVGFGPATVVARRFEAPLVNPLTPAGWTHDEKPAQAGTVLGLFDFGAGRSAVYDFTDNQWWNPLRGRRIVVRGSHGEIVDDSVTTMADPVTPIESRLVRRQLGIDLNLEGTELATISANGRVLYRNPFPGARMSDDDLAVAQILRDTGRWARGAAPEPYPLAEGCQDHLLSLAMLDSAERGGAAVTTERERWAPGRA